MKFSGLDVLYVALFFCTTQPRDQCSSNEEASRVENEARAISSVIMIIIRLNHTSEPAREVQYYYIHCRGSIRGGFMPSPQPPALLLFVGRRGLSIPRDQTVAG